MIIVFKKEGTGMTHHSNQRDAILRELSGRKDHPTAESLYFSLKNAFPAMSLATVYRNLSLFEEEKKIIRIGSGRTARYDADLSDHQHLVCRICGSVTDIPLKCAELCGAVNAQTGAVAEKCRVIFEGICADCRKAAVK